MTALVGSSGSGKSTTIGLISAFYTPSERHNWLGRVGYDTVRLDSYRTRLGVVLQESFLFDGTIRETLPFSRPRETEAEIMRACKIARVDIRRKLSRTSMKRLSGSAAQLFWRPAATDFHRARPAS